MRRTSLPRRALALAAATTLSGAPRTARADGVPPIAWDAPAGCPAVDALQAAVVRLVGADVATAVTDVRARVEPRGDLWHLVVTLRDDGRVRERTLTTGSCAAAAEAAAFIVAIAVDPAVGGLDPAPDPDPVLVPTPPASAPPVPAPPREPVAPQIAAPIAPQIAEPIAPPADRPAPAAAARRPRTRGLVHIGPALQVGMAPVGPGLAVAAGLQRPRLRVTLGYVRWFPAPLRSAARPDLGGDLSVHAAALRAGPRLRAGPLELPLHLGLELGALRAVGIGGDVNFTRHALWGAALAGLGVAWAPRALRGRGALVLTAEAAIPLHRPRFVFDGAVELGRIGPAAFRGQLLVEARFP